MKYVVTGCSGFVGRNFIDMFYTDVGLRICNSPGNPMAGYGSVYWHDLRNSLDSGVIPASCNYMMHLASITSMVKIAKRPDLLKDILAIDLNAVDVCRRARIGIFAASSIYAKAEATTPYLFGKRCLEQMLQMFHNTYGLQFTVIRYPTIFGPGDLQNRLIPKWIKLMAANRPVQVYGTRKVVHLAHVKDVVSLTKGLLDCGMSNRVLDMVGHKIKLTYLFDLLKSKMNSKSILEIRSNRVGEPDQIVFAVDDFYNMYEPLESSLQSTVDWYLNDTNYLLVKEDL